MKSIVLLTIVLIVCGHSTNASDRGNCPAPAPNWIRNDGQTLAWAKGSEAPQPDAISTGPLRLVVVVSDKGAVCSVQILVGVDDKPANEAAKKTVASWHFAPAKKDGHGVPVVVAVDLNSWRLPNGSYVFTKTGAPTSATSNESKTK